MGPFFVPSLFLLLASIAMASVVTSSIYFLFRFLESRHRLSCAIVSFLVVSAVFYVSIADGFTESRLWFFVLGIALGFMGSILHRKSVHGVPKFISSWLLMSAVSLLSFVVNLILLVNLVFGCRQGRARHSSKSRQARDADFARCLRQFLTAENERKRKETQKIFSVPLSRL